MGQLALEFRSYYWVMEQTSGTSIANSYESLSLEELVAFLVDPQSEITKPFCLAFSQKLAERFFRFEKAKIIK